MRIQHFPASKDIQGKIVIICGPTASGKSQYAIDLARRCNGVIINADSMQVYHYMPILTAQATIEQQLSCPHKLYSIINPDENFSVAKWLKLAKHEIEQAYRHNQTPIVVGGTGMYISSLLNGLACLPEVAHSILREVIEEAAILTSEALHQLLAAFDGIAAGRIKVGDRQRAIRAIAVYRATGKPLSAWQAQTQPYYQRTQFYIIGILPDRELVYKNCDARFETMLASGAVDEVRRLIEHYPDAQYPKVLGLQEIRQYIDGNISWEKMVLLATQYTRNYAKRQFTWFRNQIKQYDLVVGNPN